MGGCGLCRGAVRHCHHHASSCSVPSAPLAVERDVTGLASIPLSAS